MYLRKCTFKDCHYASHATIGLSTHYCQCHSSLWLHLHLKSSLQRRIGDWLEPYQLLEYQTDMRRCRFDTLGKQTSAHLAGGPTPYKGWVPPARWVSADAASAGPPTARVGLQPTRTVGGVHPPCGQDISPPAWWVGLFPAHNSVGLLLIEFSQESGWLLYCNVISV